MLCIQICAFLGFSSGFPRVSMIEHGLSAVLKLDCTRAVRQFRPHFGLISIVRFIHIAELAEYNSRANNQVTRIPNNILD